MSPCAAGGKEGHSLRLSLEKSGPLGALSAALRGPQAPDPLECGESRVQALVCPLAVGILEWSSPSTSGFSAPPSIRVVYSRTHTNDARPSLDPQEQGHSGFQSGTSGILWGDKKYKTELL